MDDMPPLPPTLQKHLNIVYISDKKCLKWKKTFFFSFARVLTDITEEELASS